MPSAPAPELPPYDGILLADVRIVTTEIEAASALAALSAADVLGFDTESKPTFAKGEVSTGPHLVQLATDELAYLFQIGAMRQAVPGLEVLRTVLESQQILKVGFGLSDDLKRIRAKLGIEPQNVLDLSRALRRGERNTVGAKAAVARFFGRHLQKSKRITTTNWSLPKLTEKQILYAADDAHVALRIYRHWLESHGVSEAS
ncbi:3'-5' exonuclease [Massilia horti]|uniref:3'-5' exonuclease domain-containing protein 2 n=1 Tax=Massilia horti TaxID=2562153 RepID=A0A4Y9T3I8_9BURK|nr:3'-5' exonuclease [Massilia horti]TFW31597.1 3'-5' exonuclease domain-containing protein 2 [Massilia horti]TFW31610.1 3'-5' exonuclease domain-containing protein 2 [Massilia horti]